MLMRDDRIYGAVPLVVPGTMLRQVEQVAEGPDPNRRTRAAFQQLMADKVGALLLGRKLPPFEDHNNLRLPDLSDNDVDQAVAYATSSATLPPATVGAVLLELTLS
jgi:hypothetical protein